MGSSWYDHIFNWRIARFGTFTSNTSNTHQKPCFSRWAVHSWKMLELFRGVQDYRQIWSWFAHQKLGLWWLTMLIPVRKDIKEVSGVDDLVPHVSLFWGVKHGETYLQVSWNRGTPKSSIWAGLSIINQQFWGTPMTSWKAPFDFY